MVMGGLTMEEEELEDHELHEHPEEEEADTAEAEATLCCDSRVTSMKSLLTLFVAIADVVICDMMEWKLAPKCLMGVQNIWIYLDTVSAFSGLSVSTDGECAGSPELYSVITQSVTEPRDSVTRL